MRLAGVFAGMASAMMFLIVANGDANASPRHTTNAGAPAATNIQVGPTTTTPHGWLDFCSRYPDECSGGLTQARDIELNSRTWRLLREVNSHVNVSITPMSDMDHWGVIDRWDLPLDGYGDCEDYVLLKRKLLIAAGLPRQALLVTVVKDEAGEGHAVLTAKTDHGEYVLDNMRGAVKAWNATPYRFVKRQSQSDPNLWVQIGEPTSAPLTVAR